MKQNKAPDKNAQKESVLDRFNQETASILHKGYEFWLGWREGYCLDVTTMNAQEKSDQALFFGHEVAALNGYYAGKFLRMATYPLAYVIGRVSSETVERVPEQRQACINMLMDGKGLHEIDCTFLNRHSEAMVDTLDEKDEYELSVIKEIYIQRQMNENAGMQDFYRRHAKNEFLVRMAGITTGALIAASLVVSAAKATFHCSNNVLDKNNFKELAMIDAERQIGVENQEAVRYPRMRLFPT